MEGFNQEIDNILHHDAELNTLHGKVCIVCDKFIRRREGSKIGLKTFLKYTPYLQGDTNLPLALRQNYCFRLPGNNEEANNSLSKCLLSPRSQIVYHGKKKRIPHVMCCSECRGGLRPDKLKRGDLPRFAIANGLVVGTAPPCLTRLNEIELALLSQARFRGHLFTYWGGCHRSISGWHSFYEVDPHHTAAVLDSVQRLTDAKNMAVVLCGPFTPEQKERVKKKVEVNIEWVLEAFAWLKENNRLYSNMPTPTIEVPTIIDNSELVESENTDIEMKEQISVVFPDGTVQTGGYSGGVEFEKAVSDLRSRCGGIVPYLTSRPSATLLRDYEDENLMRAFPLQFPYGYGCHDDFNDKSSQSGFLKHLLYLSIPHFHQASFVLVIHNMFERCRALNGAIWRVMGGGETCDVSEEVLNEAISRKLNGLPPISGPGTQFLDSVHAVKRNMAHTNAAAQSAQSKFLSLTHHFGCPKVLFTVSFDDALDIRILALSGKEDAIDWVASLDDLSAEEMTKALDDLNAIRYKYPGLCALNFEYLMDIVLDKIVGDNDLKEGLFGKMTAYGMAVEEQGRKTLHAHILVYTDDWNEVLRGLHSSRDQTRKAAEKKVTDFVDSVLSTELVPNSPASSQKCPMCTTGYLNYADPQQLRNLRHRVGCQQEQGIIARCPDCTQSFEGNELAMMRTTPRELWPLGEDAVKSHVAREVLKSTIPQSSSNPMTDDVTGQINYRYNHHLSHHTKTCFKKGDECRALIPDQAEPRTKVVYSEEDYQLFDWTGTVTPHKNVTVRPRRQVQDAYTNSYCKAISTSKAPANSNVAITTGARSAIYCSCYASKGTQKEDTKEYKKLCSYVGHRFLEQRRENTLFEGLSRLMGAAIVGTSEHVVSAPMASYLVRNQSRFKWSVQFKYIPVREVIDLITKNKTTSNLKMSILGHSTGCFLTNEALYYLLRPKGHFETLCLIDFFEKYEIVRSKHPNKTDASEGTFEIDDEAHPGYAKQVYRKRGTDALAQFSHWIFPDAASFGGNIWEMSEYPVNSSVERFCCAVLVLYHPFRTLDDITIDGSFHKKFKQLYHNGVPDRVRTVLSNVQLFYNSLRLPAKEDPLRDCTTQFESKGPNDNNSEADDDDDFFDGVFDVLTAERNGHHCQTSSTESKTVQMSLKSIRKDGARGCGFYDLPPAGPLVQNIHENSTELPAEFVTVLPTTNTNEQGHNTRAEEFTARDRPSPFHLMSLIYRNTRRRIQENLSMQDDINPLIADGTALSILEWSSKPELNFDTEQQKAFQIVTAAFIMTYYDDAETVDPSAYRGNCNNPAQLRHDFNEEKAKLQRLTRLQTHEPLRMFLDGPGGSGKSRVVQELLKYARQYTSGLNLKFDMRTIVVSARSGVAAVSIGGETMHSVAFLNGKIPDDDTSWANARLLIIDEVSFVNTHEVELLDEKLRTLLRRHNSLYGGINVLFCGDFRQLEPVTGKPLYSSKHSDKKWVNSINCYVELFGLWRFRDDPQWGQILSRIRNDRYTRHDIDAINECLISQRKAEGENVPTDASYCVYSNADRTAINAGIFSNLLHAQWKEDNCVPPSFIAIRASDMVRKPKCGKNIPLSYKDKQYVFENCGDSRVRTKRKGSKGHFVDPMLKLYYNMPMMLVSNDDVANGHANGTRVLLNAVVLKQGVTTDTVFIDDRECQAVDACDVDHLLCTAEDNTAKIFRIEPKKLTCTVKAPIPRQIGGNVNATVNFTVEMVQFPLIANNATTGHKLQGQTKKNLVISVWSKRRNWNYVALSRVQTRKGLFLVQKLPYDTDFSMCPELRQMLSVLKTFTAGDVDFDINAEQELREVRVRRGI